MKTSIALILFFALPAYSESDCKLQNKSVKEIDLRAEMGPIRNQGGVGWCYAFTAADLMTHYRLKKKQISSVTPETMVSAVGVAAHHNREFFHGYAPGNELLMKQYEAEQKKLQEKPKDKPKVTPPPAPPVATAPIKSKSKPYKESDLMPWKYIDMQGNYVSKIALFFEAKKNILKNIFKTGNLSEAMDQHDQALNNLSAAEYRGREVNITPSGGFIAAAVESSKNNYCTENEARSGDISLERFDLMKMLDTIYDANAQNGNISCASILSIQQMIPGMDFKSISSILKQVSRANAYEVLINNTCRRKLSIKSSEPIVEGWALPLNYLENQSIITEAQIELLKRMDSILDKGTPVGINYYSDFLNKPIGSNKKPHASSVVGKRVNPKTCEVEYILRNSYGTGCAYYKKPNNDYIACIAQANVEKNEKLKNKRKSQCDHKNVPNYFNPNVSCEEGSGYLIVNKAEIGKHLIGVTYLKE